MHSLVTSLSRGIKIAAVRRRRCVSSSFICDYIYIFIDKQDSSHFLSLPFFFLPTRAHTGTLNAFIHRVPRGRSNIECCLCSLF